MRNNTKLKKLLKCADLSMSIDGEDISMIVTEKDQRISFVVTGSNITAIMDEALKLVHGNHKATKSTNPNLNNLREYT